MGQSISLRTDFATTGLAIVAAAAVLAAPTVSVAAPPVRAVAVHDVQLTATSVPPGGLITSFLHNQTVYCSIICPLLAQTGTTAVVTTLQAPGTFFAALSAGDVLKAIGAAAASITAPTEAAAQQAIDADAAIPAQRALNAFQVGVVGLLNVLPAVRDGLPGIAAALQKARQETYDALNLPFVPNPTPTVMPRGVFQVAVVGAINVVAAVIFPAFNTFLAGVFEVPDAVAQELAKTGNPVRALVAGIRTAGGVVVTAGKIVADAVVTAVDDVREAADGQSAGTSGVTPDADSGTAASLAANTPPTESAEAVLSSSAEPSSTEPSSSAAPLSTTPRSTTARSTTVLRAGDKPAAAVTARTATAPRAQPIPLHEAASNLRHAVHNLVKKVSPRSSAGDADKERTSQHETGSPGDNDPDSAKDASTAGGRTAQP